MQNTTTIDRYDILDDLKSLYTYYLDIIVNLYTKDNKLKLDKRYNKNSKEYNRKIK